MTVRQFMEGLGNMIDEDPTVLNMRIVTSDGPSGVVDEPTGLTHQKWEKHHSEYGVELPLGTDVIVIHIR